MQKCFQNLPRTLPKPSEIVPNSEKIDHKTQERAQEDLKTSNKRPRREKMTKMSQHELTWPRILRKSAGYSNPYLYSVRRV